MLLINGQSGTQSVRKLIVRVLSFIIFYIMFIIGCNTISPANIAIFCHAWTSNFAASPQSIGG